MYKPIMYNLTDAHARQMDALNCKLGALRDDAERRTASFIRWHLTELEKIYHRHKFTWNSGMGTHVLFVDPPIFGKCISYQIIEPSDKTATFIYNKTKNTLAPLWISVDACYEAAEFLDDTFDTNVGELAANKT